jgi:hypothetical protein
MGRREEFIAIWNAAGSVAEISQRTGLTVGTCRQKAHRLRLRGERLKRFSGRFTRERALEIVRRRSPEAWSESSRRGALSRLRERPLTSERAAEMAELRWLTVAVERVVCNA